MSPVVANAVSNLSRSRRVESFIVVDPWGAKMCQIKLFALSKQPSCHASFLREWALPALADPTARAI
jgi:hypothetical protein